MPTKSTARKNRANRANATKSTGPKSAKGKAVVSKNSLVHGLCTLDPVLPEEESVGQWEEHRNSIVRRLAPEGVVERAIADQIALGFWRLARCSRSEAKAISALREQARWRSIRGALTWAETNDEGLPEAFRKLEENCSNIVLLARLWDRLLDDAESESQIEVDEANLLFDDAVNPANWMKLQKMFNETFSWPPRSFGHLFEMLDWCGQKIYAVPDAWMMGKQCESRERARKSEGRLAWIRQSAELESTLVVLNPQLTATLQRYETAIHRALHRDLHELQRIQAMRLGISEAIPVAIDLSMDCYPDQAR